ncbi:MULTISPECIES: cobyrinate a,c-diamide synthase [Streptomyces]|uniref:Hydrogenobyrinate a,c-diamide synthase n=1 Tax=Streptomyces mordarskii TaxID=1226758 RepID=A0ABP3LKL5_9ACTN|nr:MULTISPECIES: cobyrinate a,c-diamide synthase [unclassified Streptomyces]QTI88398.1 cobyrinate a,c-diamide synthase [Streptomyces sp. AgN23]RSS44353.1 cobyrinate a,c-diamide synthase [Streptomyces sp. WAC05858]WTA80903.1 cobyrinate a,c-diamide synthase [Streptomyces antimycoticus]WTB08656.1 cobyrinate a,c-diamide synthase [Streptomyces antimycoticus]
MVSVPRLVIAAPASGSGKTTVTAGLMAAFAERGLDVSPHKVGPDYIDPGYHALAISSAASSAGRSRAGGARPGRNLDAYLCGPQRIAPLFLHGAAGCDLALVEGVMGLFDGAAGQGELASTAHVAKLLRAPVVLVVDASSQSRSVAALVHGFASWDPEVRVAGVILNKVGSDRHEAMLREALEGCGVPVFGALRRTREVRAPSRHLGLVPVAERQAEAVDAAAALAARVREGCDLEGLLALARSAPPLSETAWDPEEEMRRAVEAVPGAAGRGDRAARPVVAVAGGAAFTFSYAEHTELLTAAGARVVPFDPLRDERLPEGTGGLVIGGGFPEVYAPELSANEPLREAVAELAASGAPIAAECAGLLYLARSLDGEPMCGVLTAEARMSERLTLGYREAVAISDTALAAAGTRVRGHEFHRTTIVPGAGAEPAWGLVHPERRTEGFAQGNVHASYLHVHWASVPGAASRFADRCVSPAR